MARFYRVVKEKLGKGQKSRFAVGQIVREEELFELQHVVFKDCMYEIHTNLNKATYRFYTKKLFRETLVYYLELSVSKK